MNTEIIYDGQYGERCETLDNASAEAWTRIATYGDVPNRTPDGERVTQRFEKTDAEKIVATFANNWARIKRLFGVGSGDIPVVRGHTDTGNVDETTVADTTQYGRITALEARDDGLYAQIAKTPEFGRLLANGGHLEYSPTWRVAEAAGKVFRPFRLISLGMVPKGNLRNATLVNSISGGYNPYRDAATGRFASGPGKYEVADEIREEEDLGTDADGMRHVRTRTRKEISDEEMNALAGTAEREMKKSFPGAKIETTLADMDGKRGVWGFNVYVTEKNRLGYCVLPIRNGAVQASDLRSVKRVIRERIKEQPEATPEMMGMLRRVLGLSNSFSGESAKTQTKGKNMEWTDEQKQRLAEILGTDAEKLGDAEAVIASVSGKLPKKAEPEPKTDEDDEKGGGKDDDPKKKTLPNAKADGDDDPDAEARAAKAKTLVNAAFADETIFASEVAAMTKLATDDYDGAKSLLDARRAKLAKKPRSATLENAAEAAKKKEREESKRDAKIATLVNARIAEFQAKGLIPPKPHVLWAQCEAELL